MAPKEGKSKGRGRMWPQHKREAVLESFKGEKAIAQICQERGIAQSTCFAWREQCLKGAEAWWRLKENNLRLCVNQVYFQKRTHD